VNLYLYTDDSKLWPDTVSFDCRSMGLRHLTIVDDSNRVRGMVTRKDLMGYRLDDAVRKGEGLQGVSIAE